MTKPATQDWNSMDNKQHNEMLRKRREKLERRDKERKQ